MLQAAVNSLLFLSECQLKDTASHVKHFLSEKPFCSYSSREAHQKSLGLCVLQDRDLWCLHSQRPCPWPINSWACLLRGRPRTGCLFVREEIIGPHRNESPDGLLKWSCQKLLSGSGLQSRQPPNLMAERNVEVASTGSLYAHPWS